jgi:hypothetical protein|tara:strand:+ start:652 stop:843 length:192 start_codon:yes stop_codon:yes gene_type:complete
MIETLMMVLVCLGFVVVSLALAFSFAMNAYLDYLEASVAIEHGIRIVTERNSKEGEQHDDPID